MRVFTPGQLNRLKNEAKRLKKEKGILHQRALDEIAIAQGWSDWCAMASASNQAPPASASTTKVGHNVERARYYVHGDKDEAELGQYSVSSATASNQPSTSGPPIPRTTANGL